MTKSILWIYSSSNSQELNMLNFFFLNGRLNIIFKLMYHYRTFFLDALTRYGVNIMISIPICMLCFLSCISINTHTCSNHHRDFYKNSNTSSTPLVVDSYHHWCDGYEFSYENSYPSTMRCYESYLF